MTPFLWFCVIWWAINAIGAVVLVDKKREPITPGAAAIMVVIYGLMIAWAFAQTP